jgi:Family of unknown function (DUF5677)
MDETKQLAIFRQSYEETQQFLAKWFDRVGGQCKDDPQRKAALFVWARLSMSFRALEQLLNPNLLPDVYVICRACLEFDVALEAVMSDPAIASDYLEFDKHGLARYARLLDELGETDKFERLRKEFEEHFGEPIENYTWKSWCDRQGGIGGLMRRLDRKVDVFTYALLCQYAHGSVLAMQALGGGITNPPMSLATAIRSIYGRYLTSTCNFVSFIWQPQMTSDGQECKSEIVRIAHRYSGEAK